MDEEKSRKRKSNFIKSLRHGKFGTTLQIKRDDGSSALVSNIYQKNIDINNLGVK